ncbi:coiled-coil domain-containing protein 51 [Alligator mississippiensis]|uniref:Coiled-coil domain-containing protein 51 n=1 Tax=Alligator mississippiensis TaxID=8496 RepID=A0A151MP40_ALLMI|nr:coiled-coil domain-containing protein 51 [Alligator mississippiensis]
MCSLDCRLTVGALCDLVWKYSKHLQWLDSRCAPMRYNGTVSSVRYGAQLSTTVKSWWDRYEEFVGLNEVQGAQGKVTEAEKVFMVARGIVREARKNVEAQQIKLKEVRDRLDRVSREDIQYLELATLEHRLLQEEKRSPTHPD